VLHYSEGLFQTSETSYLLQARSDILKIHSRKMNLTRGINLRKIAEMMPGASGAEVKVRSLSSDKGTQCLNVCAHY